MTLLQKIKEEILPLSTKQTVILVIIIACLFQFSLFFAPALADEAVKNSEIQAEGQKIVAAESQEIVLMDGVIKDAAFDPAATLSVQASSTVPVETEKIISASRHIITAYNSEVAQTDDSPCITANGFNVCEHGQEDTIAANFLRFGTKVKIPELFGDRVFVVRDRMASRYTNRVDVWMKDYAEAVNFGVKVATIQVME